MIDRYPDSRVILTLGVDGAMYKDKDKVVKQVAGKVSAIDTTGAGDVFTGYFLADFITGASIQQCLGNACQAAAISVTRHGAASSIPKLSELKKGS